MSQCRSALCESGPFDMEIEEQKVNKAQRGVLNGVLFTKEGLECAPTFYIEDFYKAYKEGTSIKDLSHNAIEAAVQCMDMAGVLAKDTFDMLGDTDYLRRLSPTEIIKRLNEQQAEIERLKKELDEKCP